MKQPASEPVMKQPAIYIMTNRRNGTLNTGVTSNLPQRAFQHREGSVPGFTRRYGCKTLVWYELCDTMTDAIAPRKANQGRIAAGKAGTDRIKNPSWRDLFDELI
jgi:predicted GIY-YIG superfamily endonuclease